MDELSDSAIEEDIYENSYEDTAEDITEESVDDTYECTYTDEEVVESIAQKQASTFSSSASLMSAADTSGTVKLTDRKDGTFVATVTDFNCPDGLKNMAFELVGPSGSDTWVDVNSIDDSTYYYTFNVSDFSQTPGFFTVYAFINSMTSTNAYCFGSATAYIADTTIYTTQILKVNTDGGAYYKVYTNQSSNANKYYSAVNVFSSYTDPSTYGTCRVSRCVGATHNALDVEEDEDISDADVQHSVNRDEWKDENIILLLMRPGYILNDIGLTKVILTDPLNEALGWSIDPESDEAYEQINNIINRYNTTDWGTAADNEALQTVLSDIANNIHYVWMRSSAMQALIDNYSVYSVSDETYGAISLLWLESAPQSDPDVEGYVTLHKIDQFGDAVPGTVFTVYGYDASAGTYTRTAGTATAESDGCAYVQVALKSSDNGMFLIKETSTPSGYADTYYLKEQEIAYADDTDEEEYAAYGGRLFFMGGAQLYAMNAGTAAILYEGTKNYTDPDGASQQCTMRVTQIRGDASSGSVDQLVIDIFGLEDENRYAETLLKFSGSTTYRNLFKISDGWYRATVDLMDVSDSSTADAINQSSSGLATSISLCLRDINNTSNLITATSVSVTCRNRVYSEVDSGTFECPVCGKTITYKVKESGSCGRYITVTLTGCSDWNNMTVDLSTEGWSYGDTRSMKATASGSTYTASTNVENMYDIGYLTMTVKGTASSGTQNIGTVHIATLESLGSTFVDERYGPWAVLYDSGKFVFQNDPHEDTTYGTALDIYTLDTNGYASEETPWYDQRLTITEVYSRDAVQLESLYGYFLNATNLKKVDLSNFDGSALVNMGALFASDSALTSVTFGSSFDTSNVTTMNGLFSECTALKSVDVSMFDTSSCKDIGSMFKDCTSLQSIDVSNFNTAAVTEFSQMFLDCSSLKVLDISNMNLSSAKTTTDMLSGMSSLHRLEVPKTFGSTTVTVSDTTAQYIYSNNSIGTEAYTTLSSEIAGATLVSAEDTLHTWDEITSYDKVCEDCEIEVINLTYIDKPTGASKTYTGKTITGAKAGTGYTVTGTTKAINVGTYTVTAVLADGYAWSDGSRDDYTYTWKIVQRSIAGGTIDDIDPIVINEDPAKPTITLTVNNIVLTLGTDYTVTYSNNTAAGTATVKATGKGNYKGTLSKTFTVIEQSYQVVIPADVGVTPDDLNGKTSVSKDSSVALSGMNLAKGQELAVSVQSKNAFILKHETNATASINYKFTLDGSTTPLTGSDEHEIYTKSAATEQTIDAAGEVAYDVEITSDAVKSIGVAGRYEDILTFRVTTREA